MIFVGGVGDWKVGDPEGGGGGGEGGRVRQRDTFISLCVS